MRLLCELMESRGFRVENNHRSFMEFRGRGYRIMIIYNGIRHYTVRVERLHDNRVVREITAYNGDLLERMYELLETI